MRITTTGIRGCLLRASSAPLWELLTWSYKLPTSAVKTTRSIPLLSSSGVALRNPIIHSVDSVNLPRAASAKNSAVSPLWRPISRKSPPN